MKKVFLYMSVVLLGISTSCRSDSTTSTEEVSIETQNANDDQAISKILDEYYFDSQGLIKKFDSSITTDDNEPKLSTYNPVKLPSGVVYIVRPNAQPNPGTTIGETDVIRLMSVSFNYVAKNTDNLITYDGQLGFKNTVSLSGVPEVDPFYYYAKPSIIAAGKTSAFYQIEGLREGLQYFKSFNIDDSANYNMQGVILVPSRAAYARDENVFDTNYVKFKDRSFVFNFQVYKTTPRN